MIDSFQIGWVPVLRTIYQILTAGVSITAFAIFLYSLAFNFKSRVVRSFGMILLCMVLIFTGESIASVSTQTPITEFFLQIKWFGIVFLPTTYFHFSDAVLTLTGCPSHGKRRLAVYIFYGLSLLLAVLIPEKLLVGNLSQIELPTPYLERTGLTGWYTLYYILILILAWYNLARAVIRTKTNTSRRRLIYLLLGTLAPGIASITFLLHGLSFYYDFPILFFSISIIGTVIMGFSLVVMAYTVAFFGITWTDRVVKSRLFKWLMRGPFVAAVALGITTIIRRIGELYGQSYTAFVPIAMVGTILLMEYLITLLAPYWERWLFHGEDQDNLSLIRSLEDHFLTRNDLDQFLEIILASICDLIQAPGAFIAIMNGNSVDYTIKIGDFRDQQPFEPSEELLQQLQNSRKGNEEEIFQYNDYGMMFLSYKSDQNGRILLGVCGFSSVDTEELSEEDREDILLLGERAALAIKDRRMQQQVLESLEELQPQVNYIQKLRAISGYNQTGFINADDNPPLEDMSIMVKEALVHYWGGPKLTESPLIKLGIVKASLPDYDGNNANALRGMLKSALEKMKPEGERRLTNEWVLYNLLEMKYLEGKKVREIATRLALSEADLYRKQRVALEEIAKVIIDMEAKYHMINTGN